MKRISKFSVAITAATLAAIPVAPAYADPTGCENPSPEMTSFCKGIQDLQNLRTPTPTTTAPSSTSSGGGLGGWVSEHAGLIVLVVLGLIALAVWRSAVSGNAKESATREAGTLARGRRIAEDWYANEVAKAQAEAAAMVPDRSVFDPAGVGLAPPPPPQPRYVPRPPMTNTDLKRYAAFDTCAAWTPGTAFAAVTTPDGSTKPAIEAWNRACEAAGAGHTDEGGTFAPIATLVRVFSTKGGRSAIIAVEPRDVTIGERELNRVRELFARLARVRTVHPFTRDHATGWFESVLSNDEDQPAAPSPAPSHLTAEQVDADDPWS